jgi:membrane protein
VLALFPMLVFVISVALLVLDPDTVREGAMMAMEAMPPSARELIMARVDALLAATDAGVAIAGLLLALWGASRGAVALMTALDTIFDKQETRPWLERQLIAIGITVGVAGLIVIALGLLVIGPHIGHLIADRLGLGAAFDVAWGIARWIGAGLLVMIVWAISYKFLPNTDAPFRIFTPGAIVGVLAWLAISGLFGLYLAHFNSYEATYGTLGGAIVFLTWLWLSNIAMLFGAEINDVLADFRRQRDTASAQLSHATAPSAQSAQAGERAHARPA